MNSKYLVLGATLLLSITGLTSCGPKKDSKKILFWHTFGQGIQRAVNTQAEKFEKLIKETEGIDVDIVCEYQGGYDELSNKIVNSFATGSTPTVSVAYPDNVATYLSEEPKKGDYVINLKKFIDDPEIGLDKEKHITPLQKGVDDIVDSFYKEGTNYKYEGVYSMPYLKSTELMLYNRDVIPQVLIDMGIQTGVDQYMRNLTWDQLMAMLRHINENRAKYGMEDTDKVKKFPLFYDSDANLFISQCYQRGIDYISMDKDGKGSIDFKNDEAKALVTELKGLHDEGILITKGTNKNEYGSNFFKAQNALFCVGSTGGTAYSDPGESFSVGVCKFPAYTTAVGTEKEKYVSQGVTLTLFNNPGDSAEINDFKTTYGWKFIKYLTNTENSINACLSSSGYIPARYSCYEDPNYAEYLEQEDYMSVCANIIVNDLKGRYFNYPVFKGSDRARDQVGAIITNVFSGKWKLDEGFDQAYENVVKFM